MLFKQMYDVYFNGKPVGSATFEEHYSSFIDSSTLIYASAHEMWDKLGLEVYILTHDYHINVYDFKHGHQYLTDDCTSLIYRKDGKWCGPVREPGECIYDNDYAFKVEMLMPMPEFPDVNINIKNLTNGSQFPSGYRICVYDQDEYCGSLVPGVYYDDDLNPDPKGKYYLDFNGKVSLKS